MDEITKKFYLVDLKSFFSDYDRLRRRTLKCKIVKGKDDINNVRSFRWYTPVETWWHTVTQGGELKGKLANWVGSQYSSHYLGTLCIQHHYRWCAHLGLPVFYWTDSPRRFKWTCQFRRKTKYVFWACAITFPKQSNNLLKVSKIINCVDGS